MNRNIYCYYAPIKPHQHSPHYHFLSNFPIIVFNIYFLFYFNIYTFSNFSPFLPFHLSTTLYINIILLLSLHLPLFCLFLFTLSYYKFVTIYFILCIVFSHKKRFSLSLSLSIFWWIFYTFFYLCQITNLWESFLLLFFYTGIIMLIFSLNLITYFVGIQVKPDNKEFYDIGERLNIYQQKVESQQISGAMIKL